jgi:hypothetical protein
MTPERNLEIIDGMLAWYDNDPTKWHQGSFGKTLSGEDLGDDSGAIRRAMRTNNVKCLCIEGCVVAHTTGGEDWVFFDLIRLNAGTDILHGFNDSDTTTFGDIIRVLQKTRSDILVTIR